MDNYSHLLALRTLWDRSVRLDVGNIPLDAADSNLLPAAGPHPLFPKSNGD